MNHQLTTLTTNCYPITNQPIHSQKERKTMKNKIIRNKKEKLIIENKKLHTET